MRCHARQSALNLLLSFERSHSHSQSAVCQAQVLQTEPEGISGYWAGSGMQQRRPGAGVVSHRQARRAFLAAAAKETLPSSCASRYLVNPACPSTGSYYGPHKFTLEMIRNHALGWSRWTQGPIMGPWQCWFPCRNVNHELHEPCKPITCHCALKSGPVALAIDPQITCYSTLPM